MVERHEESWNGERTLAGKKKLTMRLVESIPRGVVARRLEYPRPEQKCPNMVTEQVSIDDIW